MKKILITLVGLFTVVGLNTVNGQSAHNCDSHSCADFELLHCRENAENQLAEYLNDIDYQTYFLGRYGMTINRFTQLNQIHAGVIMQKLIDGLCKNSIQLENVVSEIDLLISIYENDIWLEEPQDLSSDVIHIGKYYTIPKDNPNNIETFGTRAAGEPCNNADFETCDYTGWETYCGSVNNNPFEVINPVAYTPGGGCPGSGNDQHLIVTGGNDPIVGVPMVSPDGGSCSVRVGDGTGTGSRASVLRQTFLVDASSTVFTYSYAAILEDPSHTIGEQPFVRVRLYDESGQSIACAEYEAYGGDGQTGWITNGGVTYRDWTTVFASLEDYVGQDVVMEFAVGDCSQSGHYGYAYVDASCEVLEIEAYCDGQNTILRAPDGAASYLWSTGEVTQEIGINTAGNYWCEVTPVQGASCNILVEIDIEPFPVPQPDFLANPIEICQGDQIQFSDETVIDAGGSITTYQWDFGDGIETPHSNGAIAGVPQTTGTYTLASHQYPNSGVYDVELTVYSADGCYDSYTSQVTVNPLPTATIAGTSNVCLNDAEPQITFTAANGVSPYTFTYNINGGPDLIAVTAMGDNTIDVPVPTNNTGTFNYNLVSVLSGSGACGQAQVGLATVIVSPLPEASVSGATTICVDSPEPQVTFTGQNGTPPYTFTYNINGGANQMVSTVGASSSVTVNVPTGVAGTFEYNLVNVEESSVSQCNQNQNESVIIEITPLPTATINGTVSVCQYDTNPDVLFEGAGATNPYTFTYNINGGANQVVSSQVGNNDVIVGAPTNQVGTFDYNIVSVVDANGCSQNQIGTITVEVNPLPTATINGTTQVCLNDAEPLVTFEGQNGVEPFTFTYSFNGGADQTISTTGGSTVTISVPTNVSGDFVFDLLGVEESSPMTCGQNQVGTVTVTVHPLPIVSAGNDIAVCEDYTVVLTGSGASSYVWDNGAINGQSFVPTSSGTYTVIGTDNNGCQASDQMDIIWTPTPQVNFVGDILDGCMPVVTEFVANTTGNIASCNWNFGDGSTSNDCDVVTHSFSGAGCFTVSYTVTTVEGCTNTHTIPQYVCAYPYPDADFTPTPNILSTLDWESEMINESIGASSYDWSFGDGSANSSEISPIHEFPSDEGGSYLVTLVAYSDFGCTDTISQLVVVNEELVYYIPNTFTPDNDDFNEVFKPIFTLGYDPYNFNMLIFNRWGEVLFESNNADVGWDGTYGGGIVQDGVYIWKITFKINGIDKRHSIVGHVNLIR